MSSTAQEPGPQALYDAAYFAPYKNDPVRDRVLESEHAKIVALRPHGGRILDVGCGTGGFLALFDPARWERYGVDVSDVAVAESRRLGIQVNDYVAGYEYPDAFFDVIVCRGAIQHLDTPFAVMKRCSALLKPGGLFAFLQTPNANSICYRLFGTLPFLSPAHNFYVPSDTTLPNALRNFGLDILRVEYPYLGTPYAHPVRDHWRFLLRLLGMNVKFAFWGNVIEVFAEKPGQGR